MCYKRKDRGFTLLELMIVIVIIGLMAGVVTINVRGYLDRAKENTARQEIATICHALETFYATYGRYPTNEEGIEVLCKPTEKLHESLLSGKPVDPWGHAYQYNSPGSSGPYEVICYGSDNREGGEGAAADISSNNLKK